jgi:UDP-N-acetylmuramyl tripeptide synthase
MDVVAVTGTNGKTSSAWWIAQALTRVGRRCGVVGTLGVGEPERLEYTGLTTPDPVRLQAAFRQMRDQGFEACAIEASSHGLCEHRLVGTQIKVGLFTNLTQDHLDYHGTMEAYAAAKRQLFDWQGLRAAVFNVDDATGARWAAELPTGSTCGASACSRVRACAPAPWATRGRACASRCTKASRRCRCRPA